jgi:simple sugar transport system permease protein
MEYMGSADAPGSVGAAVVAVLLALALCAVLGLVNGVLVAYVGLQPFITTLVMMLAGRGIAKVITGGQNTTATNDRFRWIANGYVLGLPVVTLIAVAILVVVAVVVRRTALGMLVEAIGINPVASRLAGVNGRALLITVYIVSAVLGGVAGLFATGSVMTVDVSQTGYQLELDAILAVVIGGTSLAGGKFSLAGAALGALLIATLDKTVVFLGVPSAATPAFKAAVIIAIYLIQSGRVGGALGSLRRHPGATAALTEAPS